MSNYIGRPADKTTKSPNKKVGAISPHAAASKGFKLKGSTGKGKKDQVAQ